MCGIFGIVSSVEHPSSVVVEGLKDLEYRGYDSWGVAVTRDGTVMAEKQVGKIGSAESHLPASTSSLGHTRWATHGSVTQVNAHPHIDCGGRLAVIHNGIVENHNDIRSRLHHHTFLSETDTEVVVHLLEEEMAKDPQSSVLNALISIFPMLHGLSAIAVLDGHTGEVAAIKNGSPLIIGVGDSTCYLASDPVALLPHTRRLVFVEDGQAVSIQPEGPTIADAETGRRLEPDIRVVNWMNPDRDLGPFDHYMAKEINEQPQVLRHLAATKHEEVDALATLIQEASTVFITGCGTAHNAGLAAQYLFMKIAGKHIIPVMSSEMSAMAPMFGPDTLVIALSQSGETVDVLDAVRTARAGGAKIAALTNSEGSSLYRMSDKAILLEAGPERCVLATKTYTAKLALLMMAAYSLSGDADEGRRVVAQAALLIESQLVDERDHAKVYELALRLKDSRHIFVLGRQTNYPLALEAALKIKEVSYIHAEGFASGELKHGVIALIEEGTPCLIFATEPQFLRETLAGAAEVSARGAFTVGFCQEAQPEFDVYLHMHGVGDATMFEVAAVSQLLAYNAALVLDRDPDKPRNLAKSVTVK